MIREIRREGELKGYNTSMADDRRPTSLVITPGMKNPYSLVPDHQISTDNLRSFRHTSQRISTGPTNAQIRGAKATKFITRHPAGFQDKDMHTLRQDQNKVDDPQSENNIISVTGVAIGSPRKSDLMKNFEAFEATQQGKQLKPPIIRPESRYPQSVINEHVKELDKCSVALREQIKSKKIADQAVKLIGEMFNHFIHQETCHLRFDPTISKHWIARNYHRIIQYISKHQDPISILNLLLTQQHPIVYKSFDEFHEIAKIAHTAYILYSLVFSFKWIPFQWKVLLATVMAYDPEEIVEHHSRQKISTGVLFNLLLRKGPISVLIETNASVNRIFNSVLPPRTLNFDNTSANNITPAKWAQGAKHNKDIREDMKSLSIKRQPSPKEVVPQVSDNIQSVNMDIEEILVLSDSEIPELSRSTSQVSESQATPVASSSSSLSNASAIMSDMETPQLSRSTPQVSDSPTTPLTSSSSAVSSTSAKTNRHRRHQKRILVIHNVPATTSHTTLRKLIGRHGVIERLQLPKVINQQVIAKMQTKADAKKVQKALDGYTFDGHKLQVTRKREDKYCNDNTSSSSSDDSLSQITPEYDINFVCRFCDRDQLTNDALKIHLKTIHGISINLIPTSMSDTHNGDFKCDICQDTRPTRDSLDTHSLSVHGVLSKRDHYAQMTKKPEPPKPEPPEPPIPDLNNMELNSFQIFPTHKVETWPNNQRGAPYYLAWKNPSSGTIKRANIKTGSVVHISCGVMPQPQVAEGNITVKNNEVVLSIRNSFGVTMILYPDIAVEGITAHILPYIRDEVTKVNPTTTFPLSTNLPLWHLKMKRLKFEQWSIKKQKGISPMNCLVRTGDPSNLTVDISTDFRRPMRLPHPQVNVRGYTPFGPFTTQENPRAVRVTPNSRCTKVLCSRCTKPIYCHCDCSQPRN